MSPSTVRRTVDRGTRCVGGAGDDVERQLQVALVLQCAEMVGAIDRVFEFTVQWAFDRYSFGRPLASYQALKHRFADMKMWLEACQATASRRRRAVGQGAVDAGELARVAKAYIGERRRKSCRTACSCTAASASPGNTTSTSTCAGSRSCVHSSVHQAITYNTSL